MWTSLGFALALTLHGADLPPEVLLVARTMQANRKSLTQLPQCTCLETIVRAQPTKKAGNAKKQDTVQLDVGIGDSGGIYSWRGDATFSSKSLAGLVGHGLLASGLFHGIAANIFVGEVAVVTAAGKSLIDGREVFHFTYAVPVLVNAWEVNWAGRAEGVRRIV